MTSLRELIARYLSWIQTGGQRASLAGMDMLAREDTFEIEEDLWDFDGEVTFFVPFLPFADEFTRTMRNYSSSNLEMSHRGH